MAARRRPAERGRTKLRSRACKPDTRRNERNFQDNARRTQPKSIPGHPASVRSRVSPYTLASGLTLPVFLGLTRERIPLEFFFFGRRGRKAFWKSEEGRGGMAEVAGIGAMLKPNKYSILKFVDLHPGGAAKLSGLVSARCAWSPPD